MLRKLVAFGSLSSAVALVCWGCGADSTGPGEEVGNVKPAAAFVAAGDAQVGPVGQRLPVAVVVQVEDQSGRAVRHESITFRVTVGGGSVSHAAAMTDDDGTASTGWTLGTAAGIPQRLVATVASAPHLEVTFGATAVPGVAAALFPDSGSGQTGASGTRLPQRIVASVRDRYGNGVPGETVFFVTTTNSGVVDSAYATTDASGRARTGWTLGASGPNIALAVPRGTFGRPVLFIAVADPP
jgi:hypothetical protein